MTVRVYRSSEFGAPVLDGLAGSLINVMDACLVNGFGMLTITSLTQIDGVATAVTDSPHLYVNSPKVTIAGAVQPEYNGEVTATVTGSNTFTFPVSSATPSPATGTLTTARASAGFTKAHQGTNLAAYRQPLSGANGFYYRVDDGGGQYARVVGYETMSSISVGENPFPTESQVAGGLYAYKSVAASSVGRPWMLVTNGSLFYLLLNPNSDSGWISAQMLVFGDITSYRGGDAYATLIVGSPSASATANAFSTLSVSAATALHPGHFMARSYNQTGAAVTVGKSSDAAKSTGGVGMGKTGLTYPSPVDGALYSAEVYISEPVTSALRGVLPGLQNPLHSRPLLPGDIWIPAGDLSGKTYEVVQLHSSAQCFLETSDTW